MVNIHPIAPLSGPRSYGLPPGPVAAEAICIVLGCLLHASPLLGGIRQLRLLRNKGLRPDHSADTDGGHGSLQKIRDFHHNDERRVVYRPALGILLSTITYRKPISFQSHLLKRPKIEIAEIYLYILKPKTMVSYRNL
jgi:hypothetical protein